MSSIQVLVNWKMILMSPCLLSLGSDDHFPAVRTWGVMNLPFKQYYHVRRLRISYDCRNIAPDSTYGHMKKQYDPALSTKDPDQENDNESSKTSDVGMKFFARPAWCRTTVSQVCRYYHTGQTLMLATTCDNQIFGTDPILKTVEPVKMIQKLLRWVRICQEKVMLQLTVWNPKDLHLVEKPNAMSQSVSFHQKNLIIITWKVVSAGWYTQRKSLLDLWDGHIFQSW